MFFKHHDVYLLPREGFQPVSKVHRVNTCIQVGLRDNFGLLSWKWIRFVEGGRLYCHFRVCFWILRTANINNKSPLHSVPLPCIPYHYPVFRTPALHSVPLPCIPCHYPVFRATTLYSVPIPFIPYHYPVFRTTTLYSVPLPCIPRYYPVFRSPALHSVQLPYIPCHYPIFRTNTLYSVPLPCIPYRKLMIVGAIHAASVRVSFLAIAEHVNCLEHQVVELLGGYRAVAWVHVERAEKLVRRLHPEICNVIQCQGRCSGIQWSSRTTEESWRCFSDLFLINCILSRKSNVSK